MATLKELIKQREKLDAEINKKKETLSQEKYNKVRTKINKLTPEQKEFILSLINHNCASCNDTHVNNGLMTHNNQWRCNKCMLIEILNGEHGGCYDFDFEVHITPTEIE